MARKLNWLGKLVVVAVVVVIAMGVYFGGKLIFNNMPGDMLTGFSITGASPKGAESLANGFVKNMNEKNYTSVFNSLASSVTKTVSAEVFASNLEKKFGNATFSLESISAKGTTGYVIFSINNKSDYITVPIVKEGTEWKINYFSAEARCADACTATACKDDTTLIECSDTNSDSCKEAVTKTCEFGCADGICSTVQQNYKLKLGDVTSTEPKVQLFTINSGSSATIEVGDDIYIFKKGDTKTIRGLEITMNSIGKDFISIKVVPA